MLKGLMLTMLCLMMIGCGSTTIPTPQQEPEIPVPAKYKVKPEEPVAMPLSPSKLKSLEVVKDNNDAWARLRQRYLDLLEWTESVKHTRK